MPAASVLTSVLDQQLLLQLGGRLKRARLEQGLTATHLAQQAGISRMTLAAIEAGEPSATMGSYLRVMSVLGVSKDLALLAGNVLETFAQAKAPPIKSQPVFAVNDAGHELQDLQSLMLHQEAVRLMRKQPELISQAVETLERWRSGGKSNSQFLWDEWSIILHRRAWRRALSHTRRGKELRQASPLATVLPREVRQRILDQVSALKIGIPIGSLNAPAKSAQTKN
jgi:transcriptional regulator with XRE-family HTH domain